MLIPERYYQLNQEILKATEAGNFDLAKQKSTLQEKLSIILTKRKSEEEKFLEQKKRLLLSDELYLKAKETGNQELLDKFHNRTLTRKEYIEECKAHQIDI
jgi:hypothetical protein